MTPDLFNRIASFIPTAHGWCSFEKAEALAAIILALRPDVTCEVGVYGGRATVSMAMAHQYIGNGAVVAIDPWSKAASVIGQDGANAQWWGDLDHEAIYQHFISHLSGYGLHNHVVIKRATSDEVTPPICSLLVIDGNHGPQAIVDARRYGAAVKTGGVCVLDDLGWAGGHVSQAVDVLLSLGFVELYRVKNAGEEWAAFQRVTV